MKRAILALSVALLAALLFTPVTWAEPDPATTDTPTEAAAEPNKPDPTGNATGDKGMIGKDPTLEDVANFSGKNRVAINMTWLLVAGFLVMFMQAGFALVETGLTRAKNVAHTMAMNFMVYGVGLLGFWICGFAIMCGGSGNGLTANMGGLPLLTKEFSFEIAGKPFGLFGYDGFFLTGNAMDVGLLGIFLFQMVFMDTAATIPTGTMAERWKFFPFIIYGFFMSMVLYPVFGNWVWGGGWLSQLGVNFGLGNGHLDYAGSSVVHMVGGVAALAGGLVMGPRLGKYNKDGTPNALPAHSVPMYMLGTFILAFGWFGFNAGSSLAASDLNISRIAVNTMLASAAGAFSCMCYMWLFHKKPDPSFMCNGMLAGLVAITAPCAYVQPWAAVVIGLIAGVLVVWSCFFFERVVKVDDPVGAISVHGVNGAFGVLALGLFADGTYGHGFNSVFPYTLDGVLGFATAADAIPEGAAAVGVTGLLYGNPGQFIAEAIGVAANVLWVFPVSFAFFFILEKTIGNRVKPEDEVQGLDIPEMGVLGYINEDPKTPEGHITHPPSEPRPATSPPDGQRRFTLVVENADADVLGEAWSSLCKPGETPPREFLALYPQMTTLQGTRFRFKDGNPEAMRGHLESLLKVCLKGKPVRVRVET